MLLNPFVVVDVADSRYCFIISPVLTLSLQRVVRSVCSRHAELLQSRFCLPINEKKRKGKFSYNRAQIFVLCSNVYAGTPKSTEEPISRNASAITWSIRKSTAPATSRWNWGWSIITICSGEQSRVYVSWRYQLCKHMITSFHFSRICVSSVFSQSERTFSEPPKRTIYLRFLVLLSYFFSYIKVSIWQVSGTSRISGFISRG